MATVNEIREALADQIATAIPSLQVSPRSPGSITVPAAVVRRRTTTYDVTMDGADDTTYGVTVFASFANTDVGTQQLDDYLAPSGAKSVPAAIQADPTLGGVVDYCHVASAEGETVRNYAGIDYLSAELVIEIGD